MCGALLRRVALWCRLEGCYCSSQSSACKYSSCSRSCLLAALRMPLRLFEGLDATPPCRLVLLLLCAGLVLVWSRYVHSLRALDAFDSRERVGVEATGVGGWGELAGCHYSLGAGCPDCCCCCFCHGLSVVPPGQPKCPPIGQALSPARCLPAGNVTMAANRDDSRMVQETEEEDAPRPRIQQGIQSPGTGAQPEPLCPHEAHPRSIPALSSAQPESERMSCFIRPDAGGIASQGPRTRSGEL